MKNFSRALRLTFRYRLTLLGLIACSCMVAVFWGGNIGALYPIVEVAFQGKTLQEWAEQSVAKAAAKSAELEQQIQQLQTSLTTAPEAERRQIACDIDLKQARFTAEQTALATARWLQPQINRYVPADAFQTIIVIVAILMVATVVKNFFMFGNAMLVERLIQMVAFDLRKELYHHSLRMDLSEFGEQRTGTLLARFNIDLGYIMQGLSCLYGRALREPLKGLVCLAGASFICWRLLLFSLLLTPLAALLIRSLAGSLKRANQRAMEENTQLMGVLSEAFSGMQTVKAFTMEKYERHRFHRISKECLRKAMRIVFYDSLAKPVTEILGMGVVFIALIAGAYLVLNQETHIGGIRMCDRPLSVAAIMCFFGLLVGASDPARKLSDVFSGIQGGIAAADRLYPALDRQPKISDPPQPRPLPRPHHRLIFDQVNFHYHPDQPVLRDIDLTIPFGETLCIVGSNGCGKTTLVNMLPRFHDPVSGVVRLDGVDLRDVRVRDLRRLVGVVTQQTLLFDDTVFNNIRYGSLSASREEVIEAANQAHAHRFIEDKLERGYDTIVGPGGNRLSGGQRQRLSLARAILRNPDILILDEATSQIDVESEQLIHKALEHFVCNRTAIIITHRLSTLELADRIMVMEGGRIIDLGTHDELIRRCDIYQRLREIQFRQSA
ncbi:MAG: ABC transporter ATP-binding protein [Planctomycetota bacterium]|nr:ABC transporter ATP-binding protein [Planctomycetota bacterium]